MPAGYGFKRPPVEEQPLTESVAAVETDKGIDDLMARLLSLERWAVGLRHRLWLPGRPKPTSPLLTVSQPVAQRVPHTDHASLAQRGGGATRTGGK